MPLSARDRQFLQVVSRFKFYILVMGILVFLYLLFAPSSEMQASTTILGISLCGVFWLTQRLLAFIVLLDMELSRVVNVLKRTLPDSEKQDLPR